MKLWTVLCFSALAALPLSAQQAAPATASPSAPKPAAAPAAKLPPGIPAGAVKTVDGYRFTDPQGRQWIYRPTPFGVVHVPAVEDRPAKTAPAPDDYIRATDHGNTVSFERPSPFGTYRWTRKKSEMDAGEKAALQRAQTPATAPEADRK